MNTTRSMNANDAIGLTQQPNPTAPAARRKSLVPGLLAVASCAAAVLVFKAAIVINELLACLDAAYKSSSL
jgi:hypothetical protein